MFVKSNDMKMDGSLILLVAGTGYLNDLSFDHLH